jgi:hypothetical protein
MGIQGEFVGRQDLPSFDSESSSPLGCLKQMCERPKLGTEWRVAHQQWRRSKVGLHYIYISYLV